MQKEVWGGAWRHAQANLMGGVVGGAGLDEREAKDHFSSYMEIR